MHKIHHAQNTDDRERAAFVQSGVFQKSSDQTINFKVDNQLSCILVDSGCHLVHVNKRCGF
jgi:hypothetical protein